MSPIQLFLNELLNRLMMRAMEKNDDLLYAELSGPLSGRISQTTTVCKSAD